MSQAHKTQLTLLLLPLALIASCRSPGATTATETSHTYVLDSLHYTEDYLRRFSVRNYSDLHLFDTTAFVWTLSPDSSSLVPAMITRSARLTADESCESADTAGTLRSGSAATVRTDSVTATATGSAAGTAQRTERPARSGLLCRLCLASLAAGFILGLALSRRLKGTLTFIKRLLP